MTLLVVADIVVVLIGCLNLTDVKAVVSLVALAFSGLFDLEGLLSLMSLEATVLWLIKAVVNPVLSL